ncbi:MAG: hypothetical protein FGM57_00470 [Candidatus Taylorbacteria bacterium]|nr:hypothetical protein [Candidatus Taylorbacteria bacterium]
MKILNIICKVVLTLLIATPILGTIGVFPPPTPDMYGNAVAYYFILILMSSGYVMYTMSVVFLISIFLLWTKREALAAILILPITINIVGFHAFLDNGLLVPGAIMGNILLILNLYFLWMNRKKYLPLLAKSE